jgi:Acyl-CoA reductase (LuxC)
MYRSSQGSGAEGHSLPRGVAPINSRAIVADDVPAIISALAARRESIRMRPVSDIAALLGTAGERFLRDDDPIRAEALDLLPASAGISPEMARLVLDGMARDWTRERLHRLLSEEFVHPSVLDDFHQDGVRSGGRAVTAIGPRLCVQIVSGSVPGVSVNALIRSLLVKSPTLLKPGLGDRLLPALFVRALRELDEVLADTVAVLHWPGGAKAVEKAVLDEADVAVLYGSDETVTTLRAMARATTRLVVYHHRVAVCVMGREALDEGAETSAREVARAVAIFDQRGCVSPHLVLVEDGNTCSAEGFAGLLAEALEETETILPSAPLDAAAAGALQQLRGAAEMRAATGGGRIWHGGQEAPWTVIYEPEARPGPATFARGVRVRSIADLGDLDDSLEPLGPHLQTVGIAGWGDRTKRMAVQLARIGATRLVPIEEMPFPSPWWLHDGQGPLRALVTWSEWEPV